MHFNRDLPLAHEEDLELMAHDPYKSISIDNHPREIRFYEESATCVMADNAVAELSFQRGEEPGTRQVRRKRFTQGGESYFYKYLSSVTEVTAPL